MVQILTSSRNSADAGAVSLSMLLSRPSGLPLRVPLSDSCDRGIRRSVAHTLAQQQRLQFTAGLNRIPDVLIALMTERDLSGFVDQIQLDVEL